MHLVEVVHDHDEDISTAVIQEPLIWMAMELPTWGRAKRIAG